MAVPTDRKCPTCGWFSLVAHCPPVEGGAPCDLVKCDRCHSYGTPVDADAGVTEPARWVDRSNVKGG